MNDRGGGNVEAVRYGDFYFLVAHEGLLSPQRTLLNSVFAKMGIRDEWILTPGNSASEIRRAFQVFSQSAVRVSQATGSWMQIGGFEV